MLETLCLLLLSLALVFAAFVLLVPPGAIGIKDEEGPVEGWWGQAVREEEWE